MLKVVAKIAEHKKRLGKRLFLPAHYYMQTELLPLADIQGDSYKLAKECAASEAEYIVFLGVRFMAESARILARPSQRVFLPDLEAGCPLADFITPEQIHQTMQQLLEQLGSYPTPLLYVNSTAEAKAAVDDYGGICTTSSNLELILQQVLAAGQRALILPDGNLGRNLARQLGLNEQELCYLTEQKVPQNIDPQVKVIIWPGYCCVHQAFTLEQVEQARLKHPDCQIIVHPECQPAVVEASDFAGSTSQLLKHIQEAAPATTLLVGTESNFIAYAKTLRRDIKVLPLADQPCGNMQKITLENMLYCLESLESSKLEILLPTELINRANSTLTKMLELTEGLIDAGSASL